MTTNEGYYGVTRTDEYLAHYGIKGMKWGVRKAIESGNSARLGRQYRKAQKKLAKLEARANNGKKYAKRAAALGAGAAAAGGLAAAGTTRIAQGIRRAGIAGVGATKAVGEALVSAGGSKKLRSTGIGAKMRTAGHKMQTISPNVARGAGTAASAVYNFGKSSSISNSARNLLKSDAVQNLGRGYHGVGGKYVRGAGQLIGKGANKAHSALNGVSNNTIARIGAGAAAAGLGAGAAYNAYRAATTKRAAKKAAQFRSEMNKAFAGTQYGKKPRQGKRRRG